MPGYTQPMNVSLTDITLPVRIRPAAPMSDGELLRFCELNDAVQVERETDGEIVLMSPAGNETSSRNLALCFELEVWNRQAGHGVVFDSNTGFTLPDCSMRSPDAAWLSRERWEALSAEDRARFGPVCPEFVVELLSPSDSLPVLHRKMLAWIGNGVELAWLIDPFQRSVTVYRRDRAPELLTAIATVAGQGPVAGLVLPLDRVFT